jgi:hypothetical protein
MAAHVVSHVGPNGEQDTLAFVVTGTIFVRFTKITGDDRPIDGSNDFGQGDVTGGTRKYVTTSDTALGKYEARAFE